MEASKKNRNTKFLNQSWYVTSIASACNYLATFFNKSNISDVDGILYNKF